MKIVILLSSNITFTGSGTFFFLAIQTLRWGGTFHFRQKVQTGMVATWASRYVWKFYGSYSQLVVMIVNPGQGPRVTTVVCSYIDI